MASGAVWGIDVGQCALKALRCHLHEDGDKVVADAYDYIEYPKILSQPGSDPVELVGDALKQFLSRNTVLGDRVAISVSGQAGLARFIKLPPVESKKIPDIVRYEARQQIPFDLNDVIWDYQRIGVGNEEEGFALETEVGLFAIKRDVVLRALMPLVRADIEVDIVQLTPLVLYNFVVFDQLGTLPTPDEYDPESPPESVVIISLGTDATDLVITNGFRVWQRSIPLGGSHFTKALTKELKLTFAKAEHLKRNATAAADPKAVFQAMRPVFNDLLTELQRSLSYFSNLDRAARIGRVIGLGNAMRLPGLRRYLSQSLGHEIEKLDGFRNLIGSQVVSAPSFQENLPSFGVAYGLAVQALGRGAVHTNLLPKEIIYDRLIKRKKPWAVAAAALLLLGCAASFTAYSLALGTVDPGRWKSAESDAAALIAQTQRLKRDAEQAENDFKATDQIGQHLIGNVEGRVRWLELLKAVNESLPKSQQQESDDEDSRQPIADRIMQRGDLHITNLECQQVDNVSRWYAGVKRWDQVTDEADEAQADTAKPPAAGETSAPPSVPNAAPAPAGMTPGGMTPGMNVPGTSAPEGENSAGGPQGPGWIVRLAGYHYHNADRTNQGAQYVRKTLIENLRHGKVMLPSGEGGELEEVAMEELGISYPVLVNPLRVETEEVANPYAERETVVGGTAGAGRMTPAIDRPRPGPAADAGADVPATIKLRRFDFVVHFCWQPKTPSERREARAKKELLQTEISPDKP